MLPKRIVLIGLILNLLVISNQTTYSYSDDIEQQVTGFKNKKLTLECRNCTENVRQWLATTSEQIRGSNLITMAIDEKINPYLGFSDRIRINDSKGYDLEISNLIQIDSRLYHCACKTGNGGMMKHDVLLEVLEEDNNKNKDSFSALRSVMPKPFIIGKTTVLDVFLNETPMLGSPLKISCKLVSKRIDETASWNWEKDADLLAMEGEVFPKYKNKIIVDTTDEWNNLTLSNVTNHDMNSTFICKYGFAGFIATKKINEYQCLPSTPRVSNVTWDNTRISIQLVYPSITTICKPFIKVYLQYNTTEESDWKTETILGLPETYTLKSLTAAKTYCLRTYADNGRKSSSVTRPKCRLVEHVEAKDESDDEKESKAGLIAGVVVGAVLIVAVVIGVCCYCKKR